MMDELTTLTVGISGYGPLVKVRGRDAWALAELWDAVVPDRARAVADLHFRRTAT